VSGEVPVDEQTLQFYRGNAQTGEVRGFDDEQAMMLFVMARKSL
jgi:hypothetical protein